METRENTALDACRTSGDDAPARRFDLEGSEADAGGPYGTFGGGGSPDPPGPSEGEPASGLAGPAIPSPGDPSPDTPNGEGEPDGEPDGGTGGGDRPPRVVGGRLLDLVRGRTPLVPFLSVPVAFRDGLLGWSPLFGEVPGFFAVVQQFCFGRLDDDGVPFPYELVYRAFGLSPEERRRGVRSGDLLDLFGECVDPSFTYTAPRRPRDGRAGRARVIANLGLPGDLEAMAWRVKHAPRLHRGRRVLLISGESAGRYERASATFRERMAAADDHTPRIDPPASARVIQAYLNHGLDQRFFSNRTWGVAARFDDAVGRVREGRAPFDTEAKRDAALRTLTWMREHPMPLYVPSDFSPRLKSDHYNQVMNLSSALRPVLYTERDVELDLDKAHMAALVVVARRLGIPTPVLSRCLEDAAVDLWDEFAATFDARALPDARARRKAAKVSYAAVFGSSPNSLLFEVLLEYHRAAGGDVGSFDAVRGLLDHGVMRELFEVRDRIMGHVLREGGLRDVDGRPLTLDQFEEKESPEARARSLLAYVCASYEQALVAAAFEEATSEMEWAAAVPSRKPRFWVWLYQADGFTVRVGSKTSVETIVARLQRAVERRAADLGMPTRLSQAWPKG